MWLRRISARMVRLAFLQNGVPLHGNCMSPVLAYPHQACMKPTNARLQPRVGTRTPPATHAGPRLLHFCVSDAAVRHLWRFPARQSSDMPAMPARSQRGLTHVVHMTAGSSSFAQQTASTQWLTPCSQTWLLGSNPGKRNWAPHQLDRALPTGVPRQLKVVIRQAQLDSAPPGYGSTRDFDLVDMWGWAGHTTLY